nr:adenine deaminase C-terminal domain-containing protein [Caldalkalibacillus mannanilyticus]
MKEVVEYSQHFVQMMQKDGHAFADPIYTLLFLTATHLPFIRMTNEGVYLIKEQKVVSAKMIF